MKQAMFLIPILAITPNLWNNLNNNNYSQIQEPILTKDDVKVYYQNKELSPNSEYWDTKGWLNNEESNQLTFKFKKHLNINLEQAAKYIKPIDSAQASFNEWSPITKTTETIRLDYQKGNAFCSNHYLTFNSTVDKYPILNKEKSDFLYYTNGNEMIPRFRNNSITKQLWWNEIKFLFITKLVFTPYLESKSNWTQQQADKWIAMYKEYAQYIFAGKPVMNSPMDLVNPCAFKLDKTNQNNEFILTINPKTYNPWGNEKKSTTTTALKI